MQEVSLEQLLDENSMILDFPNKEAEFKKLHRQLEMLINVPFTARKQAPEESIDFQKEYEQVIKTKELVDAYKKLGYSMPCSDKIIENASVELDAYANNLPAMAKFSYSRMKKAAKYIDTSWRKRISARSYANNYIICSKLGRLLHKDIGRFQNHKLRASNAVVANVIKSEKKITESAKSDITRYSMQLKSIVHRFFELGKDIGNYDISPGRVEEFKHIYTEYQAIPEPELSNDPIIDELTTDVRRAKEEAATQIDSYVEGMLTAIDKQYDLAMVDKRVNLYSVQLLYKKISKILDISQRMEKVDAQLKARQYMAGRLRSVEEGLTNNPEIGDIDISIDDFKRHDAYIADIAERIETLKKQDITPLYEHTGCISKKRDGSGSAVSLPIMLERYGYPQSTSLHPIFDSLIGHWDREYPKRFERLAKELKDMPPPDDEYDYEWVETVLDIATTAMKNGRVGSQMRHYPDIAHAIMEAKDEYIERCREHLSI